VLFWDEFWKSSKSRKLSQRELKRSSNQRSWTDLSWQKERLLTRISCGHQSCNPSWTCLITNSNQRLVSDLQIWRRISILHRSMTSMCLRRLLTFTKINPKFEQDCRKRKSCLTSPRRHCWRKRRSLQRQLCAMYILSRRTRTSLSIAKADSAWSKNIHRLWIIPTIIITPTVKSSTTITRILLKTSIFSTRRFRTIQLLGSLAMLWNMDSLSKLQAHLSINNRSTQLNNSRCISSRLLLSKISISKKRLQTKSS
jgi:hypothetical protein